VYPGNYSHFSTLEEHIEFIIDVLVSNREKLGIA